MDTKTDKKGAEVRVASASRSVEFYSKFMSSQTTNYGTSAGLKHKYEEFDSGYD